MEKATILKTSENITKEIVIVSDNEVFLRTLKDHIESISKYFKCIAFSNLDDTLRWLIENNKIHTVISDYDMPQMNGLVLAKVINAVFPKAKIIGMSKSNTNYLRKLSLKAGIDENRIYLLSKSDIINLVVLLNI